MPSGTNGIQGLELSGGAGEIRTPDKQFRKLLLYPSELQPHVSIVILLAWFSCAGFLACRRRTAPAFSTRQEPRDSETIVRVLKLRRDARTRRRARHLNMMPPGSAPRGPAAAALRPERISFRRASVVTVVVPVGAPFMDVFAEIVKPVSIRRIQTHRLWPQLPPLRIIGNHLRRRIAPRVKQTFRAAASRTFPFGFARQTIAFASHAA